MVAPSPTMNLFQWLTLVAGVALAGAASAWAYREHRRTRLPDRYPLIAGPYGGGTFVVVVGVMLVLLPVIAGLFLLKLVPTEQPALFALSLGWITVLVVAVMGAGISIQVRRNALGWLTLIGEDRLRVETDERSMELQLRPGTVRLLPIGGNRPYVQFVFNDGQQQLLVWGMIGLLGMGQVSQGPPVKPVGPLLGSSAEPLRKWLAPYIERV